jgi:RND family efflux transporter MFP subunit
MKAAGRNLLARSASKGLDVFPRWRFGLIMFALTLIGCGGNPAAAPPQGPAPAGPTVTVTRPERKTVRRVIEQPGHIEAFEQTPLFVKIAGYVRKVHVDIGDRVQEGDVLAELWVPEVEEEFKQKQALVAQAKAEVGQAKAAARAAAANLETARATVGEMEAGRRRAQANFERWQSEYKRVEKLVAGKVIDEQTRDEVRNQFQAAAAAREEVEARVRSAKAAADESAARRDKAEADVKAAEARQQVAEADARRLAALLEYAIVKAPFAGTVTRRVIDTGHFLQPTAGSAAEPLFVVVRSDTVRVFVEVPEAEAALVCDGLPARVRVPSLKGQEFPGKVTRTSWALDPKARTLRTEIDLPNADRQLRPGTYAYATITVERPKVLTLPASAVVTQGEQAVCFRVENGKAVRTPVQVGLNGGGLVEVLKKQTKPGEWEEFSGEEAIVAANAGSLTDGQPVTVSSP